jgi:hypothetical protein
MTVRSSLLSRSGSARMSTSTILRSATMRLSTENGFQSGGGDEPGGSVDECRIRGRRKPRERERALGQYD